jgi:hypothetical protein
MSGDGLGAALYTGSSVAYLKFDPEGVVPALVTGSCHEGRFYNVVSLPVMF